MNTLEEHVVVASSKTPHRRFSAVAAFFDTQDTDSRYWLADPAGGGVELPAELWGLLREAAQALAGECGVTVGSVPATLGLQEAAEFASIPLPTLLQCVSDGSIPLSENLIGVDETDTVALKDIVKLREYLYSQREVAQQSLASDAPISPAPQLDPSGAWAPYEQAAPTSVSQTAVSPTTAPLYYPEPTIGPPPISASPAARPISAQPAAVSAEWREFEATGYGTAPVSPVTGHNPAARPAPVRARAVARVSMHGQPPVVPPPVSAPAVTWAASWSPEQGYPTSPVAVGAVGQAAPSPVSAPQTWYSSHQA
ncbi:MAG: hypothetical protein ACRDPW_09040 [Mycobacteriales bacterium]